MDNKINLIEENNMQVLFNEEDGNRQFTCCICHEVCSGYGNNPNPLILKKGSRCCDKCNRLVTSARFMTTQLNEMDEIIVNGIMKQYKSGEEKVIAKAKYIVKKLIKLDFEEFGDDLGVGFQLKDSKLIGKMICSFSRINGVSFMIEVEGCDGATLEKYDACYPGIDFMDIRKTGNRVLNIFVNLDLEEFKANEITLFRGVNFITQVLNQIQKDTLRNRMSKKNVKSSRKKAAS